MIVLPLNMWLIVLGVLCLLVLLGAVAGWVDKVKNGSKKASFFEGDRKNDGGAS